MSNIESTIRTLATIFGVIVILAPVLSVLKQSRRPKGLSSGRAAGSRTGWGVLVMMIGFVGMGFVLWKPLPIHVSDSLSFSAMVVGAVFYFVGVGLYLWGFGTMRSQFAVSGLLGAELYKDHELVTNGPFAIIRHPMYMGVLLAAIGALLIFRTWAMTVFMPMSLVVLGRAEREEKLLEQKFGKAWKAYTSKVPRWIPKLR